MAILDQISLTVMPFDSIIFLDHAVFQDRWCFWPRRCCISGRWLFGTRAVRGRADGFFEAVYTESTTGFWKPVEYRWYHREEVLILLLKRQPKVNNEIV